MNGPSQIKKGFVNGVGSAIGGTALGTLLGFSLKVPSTKSGSCSLANPNPLALLGRVSLVLVLDS